MAGAAMLVVSVDPCHMHELFVSWADATCD